MLEDLKNKKILILGFGREGRDSFNFLRKLFPKKVIGIADKQKSLKLKVQNLKPQLKTKSFENIKWHTGKNYLKSLKNYDVIIKSPGIPFKILPKSAYKKITTQTEIFLGNCPGKIIGVTGTKGKSTTAALIYEVLKKGGIKAHLVGNIGKPVLNMLFSSKSDDLYVYELSSFQLTNLKKSPHIAVFLNIYPEHLDYYKNFKEYANAKANITRYQTKKDYLIFNSKNKLVKNFAEKSSAKKVPIGSTYFAEPSAHLTPRPASRSSAYDLNKNAARAIGKIFGITKKNIEKAIREFKPLPHRLEYIGTFKGIKFYNDALSTIPETTIAALDILGNDVETIFLGGFDRGLDFKILAKRILKSKIKNVILFPTTGSRIWQTLCDIGYRTGQKKMLEHFFVNNMQEAVKLAYQYTGKEKICLLSTASSSFSIFKDYKQKGNLFKKQVFLQGKRSYPKKKDV